MPNAETAELSGESSVVVPIGRGAPAQPDTEDLDAAIVADGPHGCPGIATAARRHTGGQVLAAAVGCGLRLPHCLPVAADGLAGPRPSMRDGEAAATPASDR